MSIAISLPQAIHALLRSAECFVREAHRCAVRTVAVYNDGLTPETFRVFPRELCTLLQYFEAPDHKMILLFTFNSYIYEEHLMKIDKSCVSSLLSELHESRLSKMFKLHSLVSLNQDFRKRIFCIWGYHPCGHLSTCTESLTLQCLSSSLLHVVAGICLWMLHETNLSIREKMEKPLFSKNTIKTTFESPHISGTSVHRRRYFEVRYLLCEWYGCVRKPACYLCWGFELRRWSCFVSGRSNLLSRIQCIPLGL